MLRDEVLAVLKKEEGPHSGQQLSRRLGVSRAAIWKAVEALRQEGYTIASASHRGYTLTDSPDVLSRGELAAALEGRRIGRTLLCLDCVDSTNSEARRRAAAGAEEGLVVLADAQTGGRGRRGRSFVSPAGQGLYASVLLRPDCPLEQLMWLTAWTGVAVCDTVERICGLRPGLKWPNDVILDGRKLCGILTELGLEGETGRVDYVVLGIGLNVSQQADDFGAEVAPVAISLAQAQDRPPRRLALAAALLTALDDMYAAFPRGQADWLERYRALCLTTGREVRLLEGAGERCAFAEEVDGDFALVIRRPDGVRERITAGEVSVRGLPGYC